MKMSSKFFSCKLSYRALHSATFKSIRVSNSDATALRFSTWPVRQRRGEFVSQERGVRASKSLIEDEEELSDWVNELNSSLHAKRSVNDEDDTESSSRRARSNDMNRNRLKKSESRNSLGSRRRKRALLDSDEDEEEDDDYESDDERIYSKQKKNLERTTISREKSNGSSRRKENLNQHCHRSKPRPITEHMSESDEDSFKQNDDDDGADFTHEIKPVTSENRRSQESSADSYLSETRFDQFPISAPSLKAIKEAGFDTMTVVQAATLPVILKGKDVLAKARTGTGKTLAFLVPAIEIISKSPSFDHDQGNRPITVLVICPTRELACQAASEANKLLKHHSSIGVQVVIGGTKPAQEQKRLQTEPCQILVATPGRLKDHIENTMGFATRLKGVKVLVLDEADRLLDMGFRHAIENIVAAVPKQRQTLLFSATVPPDVRQICNVALKGNHEFINTVEEGSEETHAKVRQMHLVAPLDMHFPSLYALLKEHISGDVDYKVIVFCTTAMTTRLVADLLGELHLNVREIHSRKAQAYRTRISDEFRISKGLILVTSDVSARGVDYPDVTLVVQVGLPSDRQQYIHRLGRTGRKGKEGQGILILAPWEDFFLSTIKDLPISNAPAPPVDIDVKKQVEVALSKVEQKNKDSAYQAWLGYYNSRKEVARDKSRLVELANEFSKSMGLPNPPFLTRLVIAKMGLKNVPGLRVK